MCCCLRPGLSLCQMWLQVGVWVGGSSKKLPLGNQPLHTPTQGALYETQHPLSISVVCSACTSKVHATAPGPAMQAVTKDSEVWPKIHPQTIQAVSTKPDQVLPRVCLPESQCLVTAHVCSPAQCPLQIGKCGKLATSLSLP